MNQRVTKTELAALSKPNGRPRVNRADKRCRTYRGVVYDSQTEMRFAFQLDALKVPYIRQHNFPLTLATGEVFSHYTADFILRPRYEGPWLVGGHVVEIKSAKRGKPTKSHPSGQLNGYWSEAARLRFKAWGLQYGGAFTWEVLGWDAGAFREITFRTVDR